VRKRGTVHNLLIPIFPFFAVAFFTQLARLLPLSLLALITPALALLAFRALTGLALAAGAGAG
jgi:hypothetical protein